MRFCLYIYIPQDKKREHNCLFLDENIWQLKNDHSHHSYQVHSDIILFFGMGWQTRSCLSYDFTKCQVNTVPIAQQCQSLLYLRVYSLVSYYYVYMCSCSKNSFSEVESLIQITLFPQPKFLLSYHFLLIIRRSLFYHFA